MKLLLQITTAFLFVFGVGSIYAQVSTFDYTGAVQTYTVPVGVTLIEIQTFGAEGGGAFAGLGGSAVGTFLVTPGDVLEVYVGGNPTVQVGPGGFNGGGAVNAVPCGGGLDGWPGGGASDVRTSPDLADRMIVAGGGGGQGYSSGLGGAGGGLIGTDGEDSWVDDTNGKGGTQLVGGAGGAYDLYVGPAAGSGTFGIGGKSGPEDTYCTGGGGGGGWYGGGGGFVGAGAGGSSYVDYPGITDESTTAGVRSGHGQIIITFFCEILTVSVTDDTICLGDSFILDAEGGGDITWDGGVVDGEEFTPDATGVVTYTASSDSDEDCGFSIDITIYEPLEVTYTTVAEDLGSDGLIDIIVTGGYPAYIFDWDNDGTGEFDDTEDLIELIAGTYVVVVMCDAGCTATETVELGNLAGIEELKSLEVTVYPNPTADLVTISLDGTFNYELSTINGDAVLKGKGFNTQEIALDELAKGIYMIHVFAGDQSAVIKLVKE